MGQCLTVPAFVLVSFRLPYSLPKWRPKSCYSSTSETLFVGIWFPSDPLLRQYGLETSSFQNRAQDRYPDRLQESLAKQPLKTGSDKHPETYSRILPNHPGLLVSRETLHRTCTGHRTEPAMIAFLTNRFSWRLHAVTHGTDTDYKPRSVFHY